MAVLVFVVVAVRAWFHTIDETQNRLAYINRLLAQGVLTTLTAHELLLESLGDNLVFLGAHHDPERGRRVIDRIPKAGTGIAGFWLARPDGQVVLVSGVPAGAALPNLLENPVSRDSFALAVSTRRIQLGRPYYLSVLGRWIAPVRAPIVDARGAVVLIMSAGYALAGQTPFWADIKLPADVSVMLLRDDGYRQYVYPTPDDRDNRRLELLYGRPIPARLLTEARALPPSGLARMDLPELGGSNYLVHQPVDRYGLHALTFIPTRVVRMRWLRGLAFPAAWLSAYLVLAYGMFRYAASRQSQFDKHIRALNAWQDAILDAANYSIVATDIRGIIVSMNPAAERMLGYRAQALVGRASPEMFHFADELERRARELSGELGEVVAAGFDVLVAKARRGEIEEREWTYVASDGHTIPVLISMSPVRADDGAIIGFLGISTDISDRKRTLAELVASETRYRTLFEGATDAVIVMDSTRCVDCNTAALTLFRCSREELIGSTPESFSPERQPDGRLSAERVREEVMAAFNGNTPMFEWQHQRHDGTLFDAEVTLRVLEIGGYPHILATVRDITERKRATRELAESRQALLQSNENLRLLNSFSDRLQTLRDVVSVATETIALLNQIARAERIAIYLAEAGGNRLRLAGAFGFSDEVIALGAYLPVHGSLSGLVLQDGRLVALNDFTDDGRLEPNMKRKLIETGLKSAIVVPIQSRGVALGVINLLFSAPHGYSQNDLDTLTSVGNTVGLAISNARYIADLDYQATHDALTLLPNRVLLHREFVRRLLQQPAGVRGAALLLLDLDRFKDVNDSLGHQMGDRLLAEIGRRLQDILADQQSLICRLGGDEFAVLLPAVRRSVEALQLARELVAALGRPYSIGDMTLQIGASAGVAIYPDDGADSHALLRAADVAMYAAKRRTAGVALYEPAYDTNTPERLVLVSEFGRALEERQLVLHFQPQFDLKARAVVGLEALVRWEHPRQGLLYPAAFMPMIELMDAIQDLTFQVLDMALEQQRRWREQGLELSMAVNLSARNLLDYQWISRLEELIARHRTVPESLELEITETALMHDPESAAVLLNRMGALGVRLSIDDFGTGYSSLSYLRRLPIDALKIDRSFVADMVQDEQSGVIVRSTIGLAHNLNLKIIAEGVEDAVTLAMLRDMGCDQAQGYFISRPVPAGQVVEAIAAIRARSF